jgi:hypothetical protein
MSDHKNPALALLIHAGKPPADDGGDEGGGIDEDQAKEAMKSAMEDLIVALKGDDPESAADAFRNAFNTMEMLPHEEAGEEEPHAAGGEAGKWCAIRKKAEQ